jgi:hypothetical protein
MYPRTNYEMTQEDLDTLLAAMKPVTAMMIGGTAPRSQQENANDAWKALGLKMGFDHMTVQPSRGGDRFFTAIPSETEENKAARLQREQLERTEKRIAEINDLRHKLDAELETLNAVSVQRQDHKQD